jgi:hypothetical protein
VAANAVTVSNTGVPLRSGATARSECEPMLHGGAR